jgi:hypothetical protein
MATGHAGSIGGHALPDQRHAGFMHCPRARADGVTVKFAPVIYLNYESIRACIRLMKQGERERGRYAHRNIALERDLDEERIHIYV